MIVPMPPPTVPVFDGDRQTGVLMVTPVAEGYEARCYKVRPLAMVSMDGLEPEWSALYDKDRNFVRLID